MPARDPIDEVIAEPEHTRGQMPPEPDVEFQTAAWAAAASPKRTRTRFPFALVAALLFVVFIACAVFFARHAPEPPESRFRSAAMGLITRNLKSPATASFAPPDEWSFDNIDAETWRMHGWVDSENSFSALLRNQFTTIVRSEGDDWRLVYLKFDDSGDAFGRYLLTPVEQAAEAVRAKAEVDAAYATQKYFAEKSQKEAAALHAAEEDRRAAKAAADAAAWKKMREQLDDVRARSK